MKHFAGFIVWILIIWCEPVAVSQSKAAPVGGLQPANIRINHDVFAEHEHVLGIFLDVLRGTDIHGGFADIVNCSVLPKGHLKIREGSTIRQAMDALVAANPGYKWELRDGVVNLMPRGGAPLLRTRIVKFKMEATDREIPSVLGDVLKLPEVQKREAALGLKQVSQFSTLGAIPKHPVGKRHVPVRVPVRVDVENLSLRDAFNKIIGASPKAAVWIYRETDCDGAKTFTVEVASHY